MAQGWRILKIFRTLNYDEDFYGVIMTTPSVKSRISRPGYDDREASEEGASVNDDDKFVFN